jgi:hypothetical protein
LKRLQLPGAEDGILNQFGVGNRAFSFNQRNSFGPMAGSLVQQFGQIHIAN